MVVQAVAVEVHMFVGYSFVGYNFVLAQHTYWVETSNAPDDTAEIQVRL